ncbi:class I SAM-dependent methyltransferase [Cerasicoccus arenae]|nr:class I SAM-dependent methyltransferase [Cerasicoccus arenae]MBK1858064.1 methyltransferase domain-containing protein [Cerasicoccus arenae]
MMHYSGKLLGFPRLPFHCPACERDIHQWVGFDRGAGGGQSNFEPEKRLCPLCRSFERTRHFALYLEQQGVLKSKPRMLHFAPEKSLAPRLRTALGDRYVTTDLFMSGVDRKEDITQMTFADASFDFIYCSNVLEHVTEDAAAMSELYRVLAPGGVAIVQVPIRGSKTYEDDSITDPRERFKHFGQGDHVRYYGEDIDERLERAGFSVAPFYMLDELTLSEADILRMNLGKRELIHKCEKLK